MAPPLASGGLSSGGLLSSGATACGPLSGLGFAGPSLATLPGPPGPFGPQPVPCHTHIAVSTPRVTPPTARTTFVATGCSFLVVSQRDRIWARKPTPTAPIAAPPTTARICSGLLRASTRAIQVTGVTAVAPFPAT